MQRQLAVRSVEISLKNPCSGLDEESYLRERVGDNSIGKYPPRLKLSDSFAKLYVECKGTEGPVRRVGSNIVKDHAPW